MSLSAVFRAGRARLLRRVRGVADPAARFARIEQQYRDIGEQLQRINDSLAQAARRESQVRAVLGRDAELDHQLPKLDEILSDASTGRHIAGAISRAVVHAHPFPHAVVDDVLPKELYAAVIRGLPPAELFADRPVNKQQLTVPFKLAPVYSNRVWRFMTTTVVPGLMMPAIVEQFRAPLDAWIAHNWPGVPPGSVGLQTSDGRIILRRRGYVIPPHRDPKWAFLTGILYLARRDDNYTWGTQLYTVDEDEEARGPAPHWIDPARCRYVSEVEFKRNRMLVFLNSVGAHSAHIPEDAQPEALERYIYQFRIAPTLDAMAMLKAALPDERRALWAGKGADY